MSKQEYIWLYTIRCFGGIVKRWDAPIVDIDNPKQHAYGANLEILAFPSSSSSSKYIDAYNAEKGESIFVCIRKKNNSTVWEQFNSSHAAKTYLHSFGVLKEAYVFSSNDMAIRI